MAVMSRNLQLLSASRGVTVDVIRVQGRTSRGLIDYRLMSSGPIRRERSREPERLEEGAWTERNWLWGS